MAAHQSAGGAGGGTVPSGARRATTAAPARGAGPNCAKSSPAPPDGEPLRAGARDGSADTVDGVPTASATTVVVRTGPLESSVVLQPSATHAARGATVAGENEAQMVRRGGRDGALGAESPSACRGGEQDAAAARVAAPGD